MNHDEDKRQEQTCSKCGKPTWLVFKTYNQAKQRNVRAFQCESEHVTWED